MYIYRENYKSLMFRKSSTGKYCLYLNDGGQVFKIRGFHGGLGHIKRNLYGVRRVIATARLILVALFL